MKRPIPFLGFLLFPIFLSGCFVPCCLYPRIDYIAPCQLDADPQIVHVFRVNTTKQVILSGVYHVETTQTLTRIQATATGELSSQLKTTLTFGVIALPPFYPGIIHVSHPLVVRLYRPGFQLVEVTSWNESRPIIWQAAPDLPSQVKVLESLFPRNELSKGSQSAAHRAALLFGASEYDRLAALAEGREDEDRDSCRAKWLRELAEE